MDSSRQALQTNGKLFSNFEVVLELLAENKIIFRRLVRHLLDQNLNFFLNNSGIGYLCTCGGEEFVLISTLSS